MDGFMHLFGKYFLNKTAFSTSGLKCHGKDLYKSPDTPEIISPFPKVRFCHGTGKGDSIIITRCPERSAKAKHASEAPQKRRQLLGETVGTK